MQYLANFAGPAGGDDVLQGIVDLGAERRPRRYYPDRWFELVERLGAARAGVPGCQVSLRSSLRGGRLGQLLVFHAPAAAERELRHYLAGYLELLALVEGSVALPSDRAEHDRLIGLWADYLAPVVVPRLQAGTAWLACDFRVLDFLPELLQQAAAAGVDVLHQANLQTWSITPQQQQRARRDYVGLEATPGVPGGLLQMQRRLLHRPSGPCVLAEELVGAGSAAGAAWLSRALREQFEKRYGRALGAPPELSFTERRFGTFLQARSDEEERWANGFHAALLDDPDDDRVFGAAIGADDADGLFAWRELRHWFEPPLAVERGALRAGYDEREGVEEHEARATAARVARREPRIVVSQEPSRYAFVSYRHADFDRIASVLTELNAARCPIWFDDGIRGGEQWLGVLQERIRNASLVLLFMSRSAAESRFVQMEAQYSHAIGKRILPIRVDQDLDPTSLPDGLGVLLTPIQSIPLDGREIVRHLREHRV